MKCLWILLPIRLFINIQNYCQPYCTPSKYKYLFEPHYFFLSFWQGRFTVFYHCKKSKKKTSSVQALSLAQFFTSATHCFISLDYELFFFFHLHSLCLHVVSFLQFVFNFEVLIEFQMWKFFFQCFVMVILFYLYCFCRFLKASNLHFVL